jgi:hypothetical protein
LHHDDVTWDGSKGRVLENKGERGEDATGKVLKRSSKSWKYLQ